MNNLLGLTPDAVDALPRTVSRITISAVNMGGTQDSNYADQYAQFSYHLAYTGTLGGGTTLNNITVGTQPVNVQVIARDDAGGTFDDAGGTCDTLGLGLAALAIPLAFVRKKSR
jgi:hypothetical protein